MRLHTLGAYLVLSVLVPAQAASTPPTWAEEEVAVGVLWKRYLPTHWRDLPQSINYLDINPKAPGVDLDFISPGKLVRTSRLGEDGGAIAAVNGNFFTKEAKSTGILRIDGTDHGEPHQHRTTGLVLDENLGIDILDDLSTRFEKLRNVMTAAPRLLDEGKKPPSATGWNQDRHPRTAVGITRSGHVLFVAVDGRTPESKGVTFHELADLMLELDCREALNLDGGGSTTLWVRSEPEGGIVNFPCDNKKHDRVGERAVANAILIRALDVIVLDTEEAVLLPADAWQRSDRGRDVLGVDFAQCADGGSSAQWATKVELPGKYAIELWWPAGVAPGAIAVSSHDQDFELVPAAGRGRWQRAGVITVDQPAAVSIAVRAKAPKGLVIDACRLVQLAPTRSAK